MNESPIIESGFLGPLIDLLAYDENEEIQCHAISTLRNLAASSEGNKRAIVDAGAAERIRDLVLGVPVSVQSEMTACAAVLGLSGTKNFLSWLGGQLENVLTIVGHEQRTSRLNFSIWESATS